MLDEQIQSKRLREDVCHLVLCARVLDSYRSRLHVLPEMMVLNVDVLCPRSHLWNVR